VRQATKVARWQKSRCSIVDSWTANNGEEPIDKGKVGAGSSPLLAEKQILRLRHVESKETLVEFRWLIAGWQSVSSAREGVAVVTSRWVLNWHTKFEGERNRQGERAEFGRLRKALDDY
jgi:hypothetical protein